MKLYQTGVYKITNLITNKFYIGSTSKIHRWKSMSGFYRRFEHHKQGLRANTHGNRHLQNAWNKRGEHNFKFEILATCPPEYCIKLEQWFIDNLKPAYNIRQKADSCLGITHTKEHTRKIAESCSKNYYSDPNRRMKNVKIKLTVDQVKDIKHMLSLGKSTRYCGNKYGVYSSTIQYIKTGRTWKDITI